MPTDTIYGLVGPAFSKKAVERIYCLRKRDRKKPFIVLIAATHDLKNFGVKPSERTLSVLKKLWPGAVSVILPVPGQKFSYLHRGTNSIAFRLPKDQWLRNYLKKTGPLIAPSANIAGSKPAENIKEAKKYFGSKVDFYLDKGAKKGKPSILIEVKRP